MKRRSDIDAQLHILRTFARSLTGHLGQQAEGARFNLFTAFEAQDQEKAKQWCAAMRAVIQVTDESAIKELALGALEILQSAVEN